MRQIAEDPLLAADSMLSCRQAAECAATVVRGYRDEMRRHVAKALGEQFQPPRFYNLAAAERRPPGDRDDVSVVGVARPPARPAGIGQQQHIPAHRARWGTRASRIYAHGADESCRHRRMGGGRRAGRRWLPRHGSRLLGSGAGRLLGWEASMFRWRRAARKPDGRPLRAGVRQRSEAQSARGWDCRSVRRQLRWTVDEVFLGAAHVVSGAPRDNMEAGPGLIRLRPDGRATTRRDTASPGPHCALMSCQREDARGRTGRSARTPSPGLWLRANDHERRSATAARRHRALNTVAAGEETTLEQRARCRLAAVHATDSAREAMDLMYRHGGSTSFRRESRLAECWRDLHVVGQAVTLAPEWYPIGGRVYLGMDAGPRGRVNEP